MILLFRYTPYIWPTLASRGQLGTAFTVARLTCVWRHHLLPSAFPPAMALLCSSNPCWPMLSSRDQEVNRCLK